MINPNKNTVLTIENLNLLGLNPAVQTYLDEHLLRSFSQKNAFNLRAGAARPKHLRRRMSCKGAIKKTRSINVDTEAVTNENPHMIGMNERRMSTVVPPPWLEPNQLNSSNTFIVAPDMSPSSDRGDKSPFNFDAGEEGFPPNKVQIHMNTHHDCKFLRISLLNIL